MTYRRQGSLFVPTRNIWVPSRKLADNRGFISPGVVGAIASSRRRTAGAAPAFGAEIQRAIATASTNPWTFNLASSQSAGRMLVLVVECYDSSGAPKQTVSEVKDSVNGIAWSIDKQTSVGDEYQAICSYVLPAGLTTSDSISITFADAAFTYRSYFLAYFTGCSATDATGKKQANSFGTAVSAAESVTSAIAGALTVTQISSSKTLSSSAWTSIGAYQDWGDSKRSYYFQTPCSAGSQNPLGTISANDSWYCSWVAYV